MNVILFEECEFLQGKIVLCDHRAEHIVKILKSDIGEKIKVGMIQGDLGYGTIVDMRKKFPFSVEIDVDLCLPPPPKPPIDIVLALPRPIMLRRILSQAAALGIGVLHVIQAGRVEKSFWEAGLLQKEEYEKHLVQGLEQAVDTTVPEVFFHQRFKPFIEDYLPVIASHYTHLLYAHPDCSQKLQTLIGPGGGRVLVAVGPEGGWVDYEVGRFKEYGFVGFSMGARILKVDTAVINIHGRIMAELER